MDDEYFRPEFFRAVKRIIRRNRDFVLRYPQWSLSDLEFDGDQLRQEPLTRNFHQEHPPEPESPAGNVPEEHPPEQELPAGNVHEEPPENLGHQDATAGFSSLLPSLLYREDDFGFEVQEPPPMVPARNGSATYLSTGNPCLDFFFHVVPDTPREELEKRLERSWNHDPLVSLKLICNLRDVRGTGKSDENGFYTAALWLHQNHPKTLAGNVKAITEGFVSFEDIWEKKKILDREKKRKFRTVYETVTMASERYYSDYKYQFLHDRECDVFVNRLKLAMECYNVGKAKIDAGELFPHEIIGALKDEDGGEVAELQWKRMVGDMVKKGKFSNCIAVCGVSGIMSGIPMEVSVALAVLVSELSEEPWKGKLITLSEYPELQRVEGETLKAKTEFVRNVKWGTRTNLEAAFDRILAVAVEEKLTDEQLIKKVFVFSDMEFNEASPNPWETSYQAIERKFYENGYKSVPEIVFWNLRDSMSTPVLANQSGVALVSGFSKNLLTMFLEGGAIVNPEQVMELAIAGEKYQKLAVFD